MNTKNIKLKSALLLLLASTGTPLFAVSGESGPITGSAVVDGDLAITYAAGSIYNNSWGIKAGSGDTVTSEGSPAVTINPLETSSSASWGIWAVEGGRVDLSGCAVAVNGMDYASVGLLVYDEFSEISVGGGSRIYAGMNGSAVTVHGGKASVGNDSVLWGNAWGGDSATVYAGKSGTVAIGDNAEITQDSAGSEYKYHRNAVFAASGASITIGADARVSLLGSDNILGNTAVSAGYTGDAAASTVRLGARAQIKSEGSQSHAVYAIVKGSELTLGDGAKIETSGDSSSAVVSIDGALVSVGAGAEIQTSGGGSYGVYSYYGGTSGAAGDTLADIRDGAKITTAGENALAVLAYTKEATNGAGRADVILGSNVRVETSGAGASGISAYYKSAKVAAGEGLYVGVSGEKAFGVVARYGAEIELKGSAILAPGYYAVYAMSDDAEAVSKVGAVGVHHVEGVIYAGANSEIDIVYADGSYFKGATGITGDSVLNFDMTGTEWIMTGSSTLSDASISDGSLVHMTIYAADRFTQISADAFSISDSVIKVCLEDFAASLNDAFQLVASDDISVSGSFVFDFSGAVLEEGLYWDTGTFAEDGHIRVAAVPEPAAFAAVFGLAALALAARRMKK